MVAGRHARLGEREVPSMTASATNQIVQSARLAEGTRVNLTTPDGLAVYATGLVLRYYGVNRPIVEVACDDGHLWLAQPWHLQAIPDE